MQELQEKSHNFNEHAKFIFIHKLTNSKKKPQKIPRQCLIERENFWIQTLNTT